MHRLGRNIRKLKARKRENGVSDHCGSTENQQSARTIQFCTELIIKTARVYYPGCLDDFMVNFMVFMADLWLIYG